jgi:transcriptional regulator with XRE-family HTH domain
VQENISKRFRERIRQLRKARGWTQEKAAAACEVGYKLYQLYELGIKQNPGLLMLEKIAKGYGLQIHELLSPTLPKSKLGKTSRQRK